MNAILVYQAYEIRGTEPLDPVATIARHSNDPLGISKNALIVVLGIVSNVIIVRAIYPACFATFDAHALPQVYRTFVIWDLAVLMVLLPIGLLLADIGESGPPSVVHAHGIYSQLSASGRCGRWRPAGAAPTQSSQRSL